MYPLTFWGSLTGFIRGSIGFLDGYFMAIWLFAKLSAE